MLLRQAHRSKLGYCDGETVIVKCLLGDVLLLRILEHCVVRIKASEKLFCFGDK